MRNAGKQVFTWPMLLLIVLIVVFHTELFVLGTRLYASVVDNPRAEYLLGEYYDNLEKQAASLSTNYYASALAKEKVKLSSASVEQKGAIMLDIGRHYECGRGTKADLAQAKQWYSDAAQSKDTKVSEEAKARLTTLGSLKGNATPSCDYSANVQTLMKPWISIPAPK